MLERIPGSFDSLWHNTFRLVSKRDFRATLLGLFTLPYKTVYPVHEEAYLSSVYIMHREKIPDWRICGDAFIEPWYCSCLASAEDIPALLLHANGAGALDQLMTAIAEETVLLLNEQVTTPPHTPLPLCAKGLRLQPQQPIRANPGPIPYPRTRFPLIEATAVVSSADEYPSFAQYPAPPTPTRATLSLSALSPLPGRMHMQVTVNTSAEDSA